MIDKFYDTTCPLFRSAYISVANAYVSWRAVVNETDEKLALRVISLWS